MISVIIPTLLKIHRFIETINELCDCEDVAEIIIINNSTKSLNIDNKKVRQVIEDKNIYVNPSWNKGVEMANFNKLCVLNDDVWFDWKYLGQIKNYIIEENGMIGMSEFNYGFPTNSFSITEISNKNHRPMGYACCFFIHKNNWDHIPDELKIWCGDDWIFYRSKKPNYIINGLKCNGFISATIDDKSLENELNPIKENDMNIMILLIKQGLVPNYLFGTKWWKIE